MYGHFVLLAWNWRQQLQDALNGFNNRFADLLNIFGSLHEALRADFVPFRPERHGVFLRQELHKRRTQEPCPAANEHKFTCYQASAYPQLGAKVQMYKSVL